MSDFFSNDICDIAAIKKVESKMGIAFPSSYVEFLSRSDGGEGTDRANCYIYLWRCEDIPQYCKDYSVNRFLPKSIVPFGMDGDCGYFFDCREPGEPKIVSCEFGDLGIDELKNEAGSFAEFIKRWIL